MADEIYINKFILATAIDYGIAKAEREFDDFVEKFPKSNKDDPDAIKINVPKTKDRFLVIAEQFKGDMIDEFGELPEIDPDDLYNPSNPPPDPDAPPIEEMYGMKYKTVFKRNGDMMNDGTIQAKYIIPGPTSKYGEKLVLKWSDGNLLYVPHSGSMTMNPAPDKRKYRPQDDGGAECYAKVGTAPTHVTMYHLEGGVGDPDPIEPDKPGECNSDFNLKMEMMTQFGSSGGFFFDSLRLEIDYINGKKFTQVKSTPTLIKKAPHRVGEFKVNIGTIPCSANIERAVLYMTLNGAEGIANADTVGEVKVSDGNTGEFIRDITAKTDIKGKGYNKYNPVVPIDFTSYVKKLRKQ